MFARLIDIGGGYAVDSRRRAGVDHRGGGNRVERSAVVDIAGNRTLGHKTLETAGAEMGIEQSENILVESLDKNTYHQPRALYGCPRLGGDGPRRPSEEGHRSHYRAE